MEDVLVSAPSNIALIKYMGKVLTGGNRPTNASVSYTLDSLRTFVKLEKSPHGADSWSPLPGADFHSFTMSERGQKKFLDHLAWLKNVWGVSDQFFHVYSANNFPADAGIASSASSFAALTLAAWDKLGSKGTDLEYLSKLSQRGSGSSCRSFFSPWALWKNEGAIGLELPVKNLLHFVIVPDTSAKKVSSSEAHVRVLQSPRFVGRGARAELRLQQLLTNLKSNNWKGAFEICWDEFIDMHELFESCPEPFHYRTQASDKIIFDLKSLWEARGDGPIVTMDAGSSVHVLWRPDQREYAKAIYRDYSGWTKIWGNL